jgi:hypothetical protein
VRRGKRRFQPRAARLAGRSLSRDDGSESQSDDGHSLTMNVTNSTYGAMRTHWEFTVEGEKVARFETGQAG